MSLDTLRRDVTGQDGTLPTDIRRKPHVNWSHKTSDMYRSRHCCHGIPISLEPFFRSCAFKKRKINRRVTSIPFFLKPCLKTTRIYPPVVYRKHPIRDFDTPRFMFYVCLVSIVMTFVVAYLLGCVFSTILAGPPYITFCLYHLPKQHMMCSFLKLYRLPSAS